MPDHVSKAQRLLHEAYALLDALRRVSTDDLSLTAEYGIAPEHIQMAINTLGQAEDLRGAREQANPE